MAFDVGTNNDYNFLNIKPRKNRKNPEKFRDRITVHFIGIGGISMSGLAEILKNRGYNVTGSDIRESDITRKLVSMGIKVSVPHTGEYVEDADLVVYTAAVREDNPEMIISRKLNIPAIDRATLLGRIMKGYNCNISVSGTHGKTTTTSMISMILMEAGKNPTIHVGGELNFIGGTTRLGGNEYFVMEADEYSQSFHKFFPFIAVILNMEFDHPDVYRDIEDIKDSFLKFAKLVPENGYIVANAEDENTACILSEAKCNKVTFGFSKENNFSAANIEYDQYGYPSYDLLENGVKRQRIRLNVPGRHNVLNSLAAIAVSSIVGCNDNDIKKALENFTGTRRRFEFKGSVNGIKVFDDYAHHPSEVRATLRAAANFSRNGIWCVFQPHTYTRTKYLMDDFASSFDNVERLIVMDIYAAREKDTGDVNSKMLVDRINNLAGKDGRNVSSPHNAKAIYMKSFEEAVTYLWDNVLPGEIIITMGAGNVYKIGEMFLAKGERK